jgi:hypothetical protein
MQRFGRKVRHQSREVRRIEQARDGTSDGAASTTLAFRHELAMIRISLLNKQS